MALMNRWKEFDPHRLPTKLETYQREIVAEMRDRLRAVWEAGDVEAAGWRLRGFESFMNEVMAASPASGQPAPDVPTPQRDAMAPGALPPDAPLSQALAYLGRNLRRLKKCSNRGCDTPFFIAKRSDDECCTEVCANEMRGRSKKQYWEGKRKGRAWTGRTQTCRQEGGSEEHRHPGRPADDCRFCPEGVRPRRRQCGQDEN
jgi:hypothetical protein